jgi:glycosyltransferase involved in cell wall biosynthesis
MRIAIITDAWAPQINGVVRTIQATTSELEQRGHRVSIVSPDLYRSLPCPTYPEIRLALATARDVGRRIREFGADAIHLSTEGPLCMAARRWCIDNGVHFTTAYHTQFPEYVAKRTGLSPEIFWRYIKRFHRPSSAILVSTDSVRRQLRHRGIGPVRHWGRGVDLDIFSPDASPPALFAGLQRPIQLYVGRVAVEKNIESFLDARCPGTKVIVGDGPAKASLQRAYPDVHFTGPMHGRELAGAYAGADVFVFPSKTDTFGLVMIEALACGTPVAAYPVSGPIDIIADSVGALDTSLTRAINWALTRDRLACRSYGRTFSWERSASQFFDALVSAHPVKVESLRSAA